MDATDEQLEIVGAAARAGAGVVVRAHPGTGKTTLAFLIANSLPERRLTLLVYNKELRQETQNAIAARKVQNMSVHTFHSFAQRVGNTNEFTDAAITTALRRPWHLADPIDVLVVDEAQDLTLLYAQFVNRLINELAPSRVVVALGDPGQAINRYRGAHPAFLTRFGEIFALPECVYADMTISHRVTRPVAQFMNAFMREPASAPVRAVRAGAPMQAWVVDTWDIPKGFFDEMERIVRSVRFDAYCLFPSINLKTATGKKQFCARVVEGLLQRGVPVHVVDGFSSASAKQNKVCFASYHSVKGNQRRAVFVFNFDESYATFYDRNGDRTVCSEAQRVAVSRASEHLVVVRGRDQAWPLWVDVEQLPTLCTVVEYSTPRCRSSRGGNRACFLCGSSGDKQETFTKEKLVKHIPSDKLDQLADMVNQLFIEMAPPQPAFLNPSEEIEQSHGRVESVAAVTRTMIADTLELRVRNRMSIADRAIRKYAHADSKDFVDAPRIDRELARLREETTATAYRMTLRALLYHAIEKHETHLLAQINAQRPWLSLAEIELTVGRQMSSLQLSPYSAFGVPAALPGECSRCSRSALADKMGLRVSATADVVDGNLVIEHVFADAISTEDRLRLSVVAWAFMTQGGAKKSFILYNQTNGATERLDATWEQVDAVILRLVAPKASSPDERLRACDEDDFVQRARAIISAAATAS
tara:strand:+ start:9813 stop:11918 length:2106 start_codon:yes stop_codon:yes gene_type:complete